MATMVLCLLILFYIPLSVQLDYFCHPNGTLVIQNPKVRFNAAEIIDEHNTCESTFSEDKTQLTLDKCKIDHTVTVIFYEYTGPPVIFTGSNSRAYELMCRNLPPAGVEISVKVNLGIRTHVEELEQEIETSQVTRVFSNVEDEDSPQHQQLTLDQKFEWVFEIAENYTTLPEMCVAYAGREATNDVTQMILIEDGCSKNDKVISHFEQIQSADGSDKNRYSLQFTVFRFDDNPFITVVCNMRVCPENASGNCNATCDGNGRRRRRRRRLLRRSRESLETSTDKMNDMVVVLEILDETSARSRDNAQQTNFAPSDAEIVFRRLLDELSSGASDIQGLMKRIFSPDLNTR